MNGLTRQQALEKENKDLRTRLKNQQAKAEIASCATEDELKGLKAQLKEKDKAIAMLQRGAASLTQKLAEAKGLCKETIQTRIDAAVAKAVAAAIKPLLGELAKAHAEISRLKAIINKDSSNSSKPPSTNGYKTLPNNREKSNRPKGGQKGHPGHRLALPKNMDELVEKGIIAKQIIDHTDGGCEYISRYVIDVEVVATITEHRYALGQQLPGQLYNEVSYGENIRAISVLLLSEGVIAEKRFSEILGGLTHGVVAISPATLEKFQSQFAQKLESNGELEAIKEDLLNGEVLHTDDTPLRCSETIDYHENGEIVRREAKNTSFDATVRVYSNANSTLYTVNPRKDNNGVLRDGVLPKFHGILSHDHESKFYKYGTWHAACGGHLLRELKGLQDLECIPWAGDMRGHMAEINKHKNKGLEKGQTACAPELLKTLEQRYDALIERGHLELGEMIENELGYKPFRAMLNRLSDYKDCYLLFIRNYKAPFTNNLAERDLRPEKTKQKVSGLFRSWNGINDHVKIRSFISTVKKRRGDLFLAIAKVNGGVSVLKKSYTA
jgi:hypothetical protein